MHSNLKIAAEIVMLLITAGVTLFFALRNCKRNSSSGHQAVDGGDGVTSSQINIQLPPLTLTTTFAEPPKHLAGISTFGVSV